MDMNEGTLLLIWSSNGTQANNGVNPRTGHHPTKAGSTEAQRAMEVPRLCRGQMIHHLQDHLGTRLGILESQVLGRKDHALVALARQQTSHTNT